MFNDDSQQTEELMRSDKAFRVLYHQHRKLDSKIRDADLGVLPIDDATLTTMKKEKLQTKERLLRMWEQAEQSA